MLKIEVVWRRLADDALLNRESVAHQFELATELGMSVHNVNFALVPLREIGAVDVVGKKIVVRDVKKILMLWAARRKPPKPLGVFTTPESGRELLSVLPPGIALTGFAGYVAKYGDIPAPFDVVQGYADAEAATMTELRRRFREVDAGYRLTTLVVLPLEHERPGAVPATVGPAQLYVDIWNERSFFVADYLRAMDVRFSL